MKQVLINRCVNLLKKGDEAQGIKGKAVFDIIAGTSIGAMNGSSGERCCREWNL